MCLGKFNQILKGQIMGSVETTLILKYGIPLAIKLLNSGEDEPETVETVTEVIAGMEESGDVGELLVKADAEQTKGIVDALFDVITGAADAFGGLVKALVGLLERGE